MLRLAVRLSTNPQWTIGLLTGFRRAADRRSTVLLGHFERIFPCLGRNGSRRLVREYWHRHNRHTIDLFHLERFSPAHLDRKVEWRGRELVDKALEGGRGLLLLVPHFGDERSMHILMGMAGYPVEVISSRYLSEGSIPRKARLTVGSRWNTLHFPDENPRWMYRALSMNRILHYSPTAYGGPSGMWLNMFGVPDLVPVTPWKLAARTGCAVLFGCCYVLPGMRFRIVLEPMDLPDNPSGFTTTVMRRVERCGLEHPGQYDWKNLVIRHRESNTMARIGMIPPDEETLERLAVPRDEDPSGIPDLDLLRSIGGCG